MKYFVSIVILFILLCSRFFFFFQNQPQYHDQQQILLQVVLEQEPKLVNGTQSFSVKTENGLIIFVKTGISQRYHYGDRLAITGTLQVKTLEKGREFMAIYFPKVMLQEESKNPFIMASLWLREKSSILIYGTLPPISAGLLMGILFGAKESFPEWFWTALQTTGVLHVIAASGMNVSFFTGAVMFSFGMFLPRKVSIILSIFVVVFYSFLSGFSPSILRASVMGVIAFTASFLGRQNFAFVSLFFTGFLLLLWKPVFLFDVGFQLSFLATLGILIIKPFFDALFVKGGAIIQFFKEDFSTTLSAQVGTLPILLQVFGKVGMWSVVVNALVLWTIPYVMILGSLAVLVGIMIPFLGKGFLFLCLPFLWYFEAVVRFFGNIGGVFVFDYFSWQMGVGYYLIVCGIILFLRRNKCM